MADIIQLLPDSIANQIAAGEVVQRPASVIKELMENAVDAGSTSIKVVLKDAGSTLIQVIDNGCGMSETDARMCFERHATSKIKKAEDLFAIRTMGFRGEAMASIAAVAQVELRTRRMTDEVGTKVVIEGSEVISHEAESCPQGTNFLIKNLFYNIPVRRNFLKSNTVEMRHVMEDFQRIALSNPDIFFSLHHNNTELFHLTSGNLKQRILGIFGNNYSKNLVPIEEETDVVKLWGFVGKPEYAKKTRGEQLFFVNNRFIKSAYLHHAIMSGYEELIAKDAHPMYVIFMDIDPARIDVNVHPTKTEIKFDDEKLIYNYLKVAIRHALGQYSLTPMLDFEQEIGYLRPPTQPKVRTSQYSESEQETKKSSEGESYTRPSVINFASPETRQKGNVRNWESLYRDLDNEFGTETPNLNIEPSEPEQPIEEATSITIESKMSADDFMLNDKHSSFSKHQKEPYQLHGLYIVNQLRSGYMLIDQQAASERILYEKYLTLLESTKSATQNELFPRTITVSPADAIILKDILPEINRLGFDLQDFGQNDFVLHGLPSELKETNEKDIIEMLLEQYKQNIDIYLNIKESVSRALAKSAALKKGKILTVKEMRDLVDKLFACAVPFSSPNGNKCFIVHELDDIQKQFQL